MDMGETDHLDLEHLRRIRDDLAEVKREVRSLAARVGNLEVGLTSRLNHIESSIAEMSVRFDHQNERLDRIERRLDLSPA